MPEGHTIHRAARLQTRRFGGARLDVWSPQGRFSDGAAVLDGMVLDRVDAHGKHLLYRWRGAPTLHVHLGLFGRFRIGPEVTPSPNARIAWRSETHVLALSGPTICELVDGEDEADLLQRIGPDPLAPADGDLGRLQMGLARRSIPIGAALLDQRLLAGVGNVYRAEILFLAGINPHRASRDLTADEVERMWALTVNLMDRGERLGRIVTVDPGEVGLDRLEDAQPGSRLYVYKRSGEACRRCESPVAHGELGGRSIWWCGTCQPGNAIQR